MQTTKLGNVHSFIQRFRSALGSHLVQDIITGILLTVLFILMVSDTGGSEGLLFEFPEWAMIPWAIALGAPLGIRRTYPQTAALIFVAFVFIHLIIGPSAVPSDMASLVLLYSVIVYGDPKHTHKFLSLAAVMGLLTIIEGATAESFGPLLAPQLTESTKTETYACALPNKAFLDSGCQDSLKRMALLLTITISISLISVIFLAYWQRARRHSIELLQERNQALLSRQDEERQIAVLAERARIARDMHDVVAHTLSSIIVQSDAGRYAGKHDVDVARTTMHNIEHEARSALSGMQSLLGVITHAAVHHEASNTVSGSADASQTVGHSAGPKHDNSRQPAAFESHSHDAARQSSDTYAGLRHETAITVAETNLISTTYADIPMLISHANAISPQSHVSRRISGKACPDLLATDCQETLFRIVEEALSNVRKHAGSVVNVIIDEQWSDNEIHLSIRDDGRGKHASADGHTPGFGLRGMRERVEACNGSFRAGAISSGGFEIVVSLPLVRIGVQESSGIQTFIHQAQLVIDLFRSQPLHVHDINPSRKPNLIERFSQWTQRHYVLVDTVGAVVMWVFFLAVQLSNKTYLFYSSSSALPSSKVLTLITSVMTLPLCTRRRFPFITAAFVSVCCTVQLLFVPGVFAVNIYAAVYLSSAIMYGKRSDMVKVLGIAGFDSVLLGLQAYFATADIGRSLFDIAHDAILGLSIDANMHSIRSGIVTVISMLLLCGGSAACALWARARGNNVLVLQEREDAILLEQQRQMVLSADNERNRIASIVQQEVTNTLMSVVNQAERGLRTIDALPQQDTGGDCVEAHDGHANEGLLDEAFGAIGRQGRTALAHMRTLLGILRTTGFSDTDSGKKLDVANGSLPSSELKPAASLDAQLRESQLRESQLQETKHINHHDTAGSAIEKRNLRKR
ncbi:MAG: histidine kinase [Bifidobacterium aquikefiri]|uniref:histidine kinase n=1 Tax=Bifidobacterium aquikefiri TaxID=1653207 RepID=A0A261G625_9BIFI|nr:histidine kinase [Bifidobacterium aquikefiri]OZG66879.1 histidine kinase [Bifidobacterium aquikefiri]